jgi:hypothetical protein
MTVTTPGAVSSLREAAATGPASRRQKRRRRHRDLMAGSGWHYTINVMIGFSPGVSRQGGILPGGQEAFFIHSFFARNSAQHI